MDVTVKTAKDHMESISKICRKINDFDERHKELSHETGFLCDAVAFLCDYRKTLETEIEKAELKI